MRAAILPCLLALVLHSAALAAPDDGLVGCWNCDEGKGETLHDSSGNANHGKIHGAAWIKSGQGYALQFDGVKAFVDCGNGPSLDLTGPLTLQAWVRPTTANRGEPGIAGKFFESYALTYHGNVHFYISSGGNHVSGPLRVGAWTHVVGTFDGAILRTYINGEEVQASESKYKQVRHGRNFFIGCIVGDPASSDPALQNAAFFPGLIGTVRVHNRALTHAEIMYYYSLEAAGKGLKPFDMSQMGHFALEPFYYPDSDTAVLSANFRWMPPLPEGTTMVAELAAADAQEALQSRPLNSNAGREESEAEFSLKDLKAGDYELRAAVRVAGEARAADRVRFRYPFSALPPPPASDQTVVPSLPPAVAPPPYQLEVSEGGGLKVTIEGQVYQIESSYSFPHGGENQLVAAAVDARGEPAWKVTLGKPGSGGRVVQAEGQYYSISRVVEPGKTRILIRDTIKNTSSDVVGIILSNYVNTQRLKDAKITQMGNPTVFAASDKSGVGLIALDDLYQCQLTTRFSEDRAEVRTEHFGLDKGAACTIEWAVYPTATTDYYDFINQVRRDEGINRRVEGAFSFVGRRDSPSKAFMDLKNCKYASIGCLDHPPDNADTPLEGVEFLRYPRENALLKKTFAETRRLYPDVKVMFHVAYGLYMCNNPQERFPDSRAMDGNGKQYMYGPDSMDYYGHYVSQTLFDAGWRWWISYPTLENSFGKEMIKAMEYMVGEMGATGMWGDGYFCGYVPGGYSYDRWDGHSVAIDPATKLVTRKLNCVPYAALPVLIKVARIISEKGGVLVTNDTAGPRSMWKEDYITSCETAGGDAQPVGALHVGRSVTPLGNPSVIRNERDIYRDILTKLDYGALYFWFGDRDLVTHKTIVEHMYPITFESIHSGTVRGKERIVTKKSGVYGWPDDRALHLVYLYDGRGALTRSGFMTTVDASSVRTEVKLEEGQSAVVAKLPVTLAADAPVNLCVRQYDGKAVRLALNGKGKTTLHLTNGDFPVYRGLVCRVAAGDKNWDIAESKDALTFSVTLDGPMDLVITRLNDP